MVTINIILNNNYMNGNKFKNENIDNKFYVLTDYKDKCGRTQFKDGLNIGCVENHDTYGVYLNGLFFVEQNKIGKWLGYVDGKFVYIREVEILDDSMVVLYKNGFKTDKIALGQKTNIQDFPLWEDESFCKNSVKSNPYTIKYVKYQTEEICKFAIAKHVDLLHFVNDEFHTEEFYKFAVCINTEAIKYMRFQTEEICRVVISKNANLLQYVNSEFLTEELLKIAIDKNPEILKCIGEDMQTFELCRFALSKDWKVLPFVAERLRTVELYEHVALQNSEILRFIPQNNDICMTVLNSNGLAIINIQNPTDLMRETAVAQNGKALKYINEDYQTYKLCRLAIGQNYKCLKYVKNRQMYFRMMFYTLIPNFIWNV